jgi:dolichyl-phosphate beta-glucosyltransferase
VVNHGLSGREQSTPLSESKKLLPWFEKGFKVVIGSRGLKREGFDMLRQVGSVVFRVVRGALILPEITDTQCGFKAFKTKVAKEIFPQLQFFQEMDKEVKGWRVSAFDVELLFIAKKWGYQIKEIVVKWKDEDLAIEGKDKKFVKESKQMAEEVLRVRLNDFKNKYAK